MKIPLNHMTFTISFFLSGNNPGRFIAIVTMAILIIAVKPVETALALFEHFSFPSFFRYFSRIRRDIHLPLRGIPLGPRHP